MQKMPPRDDRGRDRNAAPSPTRRRVNRVDSGENHEVTVVDRGAGGEGEKSVGGDWKATSQDPHPHHGRRRPLRRPWAWLRRWGLVRCALFAPLLFLGAFWRMSLDLLSRNMTTGYRGDGGDESEAFLPPKLSSIAKITPGGGRGAVNVTTEDGGVGDAVVARANGTDPPPSASGGVGAFGGDHVVVRSDGSSKREGDEASEAAKESLPRDPRPRPPPPMMVAYHPPASTNATRSPRMHFAVLPRVEVSSYDVRRREMLSRRWRYKLEKEDREHSRSQKALGTGGHPQVNSTGCVPMVPWQASGHRPTCNVLHETDLRRRLEGGRGMERLGSGGWRVAWRMSDVLEDVGGGGLYSPLGIDEARDYVLKTVKGKGGKYDAYSHRQHLVDAMITERLTPSPHVVDVYGHCAQSVLNELAVGSLSRTVKARHSELTSLEVLGYASEVAAGVADLHSMDYPKGDNATAVYKDLKPSNVVLSREGRLKISDFNDAEVLLWNSTADGVPASGGRGGRGQCGFRRKRWTPTYHSPEEVWQLPLTEKVDVYALGGIIYYVLVGKEPYDGMERRELFKSVAKGIQPKIPPKFLESSDPIVSFLLEMMGRCHRLNPRERPTAREVAEELASRYAFWKSKSEQAK